MKDLIKLEKYHKQVWHKDQIKKLEDLNKKYKLGLDLKETLDLLYLQVFEESLKNKISFETEFNKFHQLHDDMWTNMTFNERNLFIHSDMGELKKTMKSFQFNDKRIYIAFFNELMNVLYDQETAILDLPQFFKLYDDFNEEIITPKIYGLEPMIANMAWPQPIAQKKETLILFDASIQTFFKITKESCECYTLFEESKVEHELMVNLAKLLLQEDYGSFYAALEANSLMSPRLEKKFKKILKRRAK